MKKIEDYIELAQKAVEGISYPPQPSGLYEPIVYALSNGGKRLRPALLLAACDAVGGDSACAASQAAAIEMYHNFTLLHDDVMDKADLRRGKPTVCAKYGENAAILSGDTMLSIASDLVVKGVEPEKAIALLSLFNKMAVEVYEGQQYDMEFENRQDVTIDEYIEMIRLKTSVLLGCASRMGAMIGNGSQLQCDSLCDFAINLGLAFQLQDDLLDVYGDPAVFGKAIGGDIMNNKKTFLLINAQLLAKGELKQELDYWLNNPNPFPGEKIAAITAIYNRLKIDEICRESIARYNALALQSLKEAQLTAEAEAFFGEFDKMIMGRNK